MAMGRTFTGLFENFLFVLFFPCHPSPPLTLPLKGREIHLLYLDCLSGNLIYDNLQRLMPVTLLPLQGEGRDGDGSNLHGPV